MPIPECQGQEALDYSGTMATVRLHPAFDGKLLDTNRLIALYVDAWTDPDYIATVESLPDPGRESTLTQTLSTDRDLLPHLRPRDLEQLEAFAVATPVSAAKKKINVSDAPSRTNGLRARWPAKKTPNAASAVTASGAGSETSRTTPLAGINLFDTLSRRALATRSASVPLEKPDPTALPGQNGTTLRFHLHPTQESSELAYSIRLQRFLEKTSEALRRRYPRDLGDAQVTFEGRHLQVAALASRLKIDALRSLAILILCLSLLLILAFRKLEAIFFIALPPVVGLVWMLGLVSLFQDTLSLLSAVFALLLLALGIEYAVQIYHRFIEELYREQRYYPALATAYMETGRGVLVCTCATGLIFFSLYLSSFPNLRELALVGGLGLIAMTLSVLLWLPLLAALKSRLARGKVRPLTESYDFGMKQLSAAVVASPRAALALGLIITAYLAYFSRDTQINREIGLDLSAAHWAGPARARNLGDPLRILVEAPSLQEALEANDRLYAALTDPPLSIEPEAIDSLSTILPARATQEDVRRRLRDLSVTKIRRTLEQSARTSGTPRKEVAAFTRRLSALQTQAHNTAAPENLSFADPRQANQAQARIVFRDGRYRILTSVLRQELPHAAIVTNLSKNPALIEPNGRLPLRFDSQALQNRRVTQTVLYNIALTTLLAILSLLLCLAPHLHGRMVDTWLAVLPLACAMTWSLGILAALQFRVGLYTLLAFPLFAGIALNQTVLLIQRLRERRYASLRQALRSAGRANIISTAALLLGMGCLAQADSPPLREVSFVGAVAVIASALASLVIVPALLQIRQEGGLAAWMSGPED